MLKRSWQAVDRFMVLIPKIKTIVHPKDLATKKNARLAVNLQSVFCYVVHTKHIKYLMVQVLEAGGVRLGALVCGVRNRG